MARPDQFSRYDAELGEPGALPANKRDEEETVPKSRLDEVLRKLEEERALRERFMLSQIQGFQGQNQQAGGGQQNQTDDPLNLIEDEDVREAFAPALLAVKEQAKREALAEFNARFGGTLGRVAQDQEIEVVGKRIGGQIPPDLLEKVKAEFLALPEDEREEYDNRVGFEALARRILERETRQMRASGLSGMAHSAPFGSTPPAAPRGAAPDDEEVMSWSEEKWEEYKRSLRR